MPRAGSITVLVFSELPMTRKTATASRVADKEVLEAVRIRNINATSAMAPNCLRCSFSIFASATALRKKQTAFDPFPVRVLGS